MATLTIRNVDEDVKRELRKRAAERGVSMEQEARNALRLHVQNQARTGQTPQGGFNASGKPWRLKMTREQILALGRKPSEPFDLKQVSDELYDYLEQE